HLHHVQKELQRYFDDHQAALERCGALESELAVAHQQRDAAHAEREAVGNHLRMVEEELEHYFLHSRDQAELIDQLEQQQQRALRLLAHSNQR
ncbi:MAG: hypothetical protein ACKOPN_10720, partial [Prochlorococcaceae cyanobacterium]